MNESSHRHHPRGTHRSAPGRRAAGNRECKQGLGRKRKTAVQMTRICTEKIQKHLQMDLTRDLTQVTGFKANVPK